MIKSKHLKYINPFASFFIIFGSSYLLAHSLNGQQLRSDILPSYRHTHVSCLKYLKGPINENNPVENFLSEFNANRTTVNDEDIHLDDFFPRNSGDFNLSQFNSLGDSYEHSELIAEALRLSNSAAITKIMDFFSGSSLPTLRILNLFSDTNLKIEAIDSDAQAINISQENARSMGVLNQFEFFTGDAVDRLSSATIKSETLVALNPPYVPVPENVSDEYFLPVHGGSDGTKFLIPFLQHTYEKGTRLALTWSSLSNPVLIIDLIKKNFNVLHVQSYETEFGLYTSSEKILPHLIEQRSKGTSFFKTNSNGKYSYFILGVVLQKK